MRDPPTVQLRLLHELNLTANSGLRPKFHDVLKTKSDELNMGAPAGQMAEPLGRPLYWAKIGYASRNG